MGDSRRLPTGFNEIPASGGKHLDLHLVAHKAQVRLADVMTGGKPPCDDVVCLDVAILVKKL